MLRNLRLIWLVHIHFFFINFLFYCWLRLVFNNLASRRFLSSTLVIFVLLTKHEKFVRANSGGFAVNRRIHGFNVNIFRLI